MGIEVIGWIASIILVCTIGKQIFEQWQSGTSKGVSRWLFIGQLFAAAGFLMYSVLIKNWVFAITNAVMVGNSILGYLIVLHHRRRERRPARPAAAKRSAA